jgi:hypothetical protein
MSRTTPKTPSHVDQILDLLLDALLERQRVREGQPRAPVELEVPKPATPSGLGLFPGQALPEQITVERPPEPGPKAEPEALPEKVEPQVPPSDEELPPPVSVSTRQMGRTLFRMAVGLLLFVVLVNVPINRHGVSLARILPDSAALVIRDGLLLKGENTDEIYVLQDDKLRWISSLEAFEHYGYRWRDVHIVKASFLEKFEKGWPVHVLLKCDASPHIYALENGQKRWIRDIPAFESKGYVWQDVRFVSCQYLRDLPDGLPIPEDAGLPPQP